ncbi:hypothetical protein [Nostoc parmelioides]|uniref:Uncharacterized protein n=1 Tax=Nostoc parmelioides FACHB-3921 TaxID=2692909 RepID=A0ABR8BQF2_9NOSO|nr:hypothetical protein [Nostoc parmelioides]MBD2255517.1 hypothetical protein [Nostoc parmelioides FACHB-3921]
MQNKHQDILGQAITLLLVVQLFLIGIQGKIQIAQGKSSLEALNWIIQQSIPVLVKIRSLKDKQDKSVSKKAIGKKVWWQ